MSTESIRAKVVEAVESMVEHPDIFEGLQDWGVGEVEALVRIGHMTMWLKGLEDSSGNEPRPSEVVAGIEECWEHCWSTYGEDITRAAVELWAREEGEG